MIHHLDADVTRVAVGEDPVVIVDNPPKYVRRHHQSEFDRDEPPKLRGSRLFVLNSGSDVVDDPSGYFWSGGRDERYKDTEQ